MARAVLPGMAPAIKKAKALPSTCSSSHIQDIICSEEKPAENSSDTFSKLSSKHPAADPDRKPLPPPDCFPALVVSQNEVLKAITSFPAETAGGSDGFRPQQMLALVNYKETGSKVLSDLTPFANMLFADNCYN